MKNAILIFFAAVLLLYLGANGLLMLVLPGVWRNTPEWFHGSLNLSQFDGPAGQLKIRLGGLIFLAFDVLIVRAYLRS